MLMIHVDRYLSLRQALGFKLSNAVRHLHCQSALKGDPQSASKRDPFGGLDRRCPSARRRGRRADVLA